MPSLLLNDRAVAALKPKATRYEVFDRSFPSFGVRVFPSGKKSFVLLYRVPGSRRLRRVTLGTYPDLTLAKARKQASNDLEKTTTGRDPGAEHQVSKTQTFGELGTQFIDDYAKRRKKSWRRDQQVIARELTAWKDRPVRAIRRGEIKTLLTAVVDRGAPVYANRILALVRKMFNVAVDLEWIEVNPAWRLSLPTKERSRDRVLTDAEIRAAWTFLHAEPDGPDEWTVKARSLTRSTLLMRLLTAQRGIEVVNMRWADIDGAWWTIPAQFSKNGLAHRVYLSPLAQAELKRIRPLLTKGAEFVYTGIRSSHHRKHALDEFPVNDFQPRDFRRTAASNMTKAGIPRDVVSKVLNHVEPGVTKVYDRFSYDKQKRQAMLVWDRRLRAIVKTRRV